MRKPSHLHNPAPAAAAAAAVLLLLLPLPPPPPLLLTQPSPCQPTRVDLGASDCALGSCSHDQLERGARHVACQWKTCDARVAQHDLLECKAAHADSRFPAVLLRCSLYEAQPVARLPYCPPATYRPSIARTFPLISHLMSPRCMGQGRGSSARPIGQCYICGMQASGDRQQALPGPMRGKVHVRQSCRQWGLLENAEHALLQKISSAGAAGWLTSSDCKPIFCGSRLLCTRPVLKNRALRDRHGEACCT